MIALSFLVLVGLVATLGFAAVVLAFLAILRRSNGANSLPPRFRSEDTPAWANSSLNAAQPFDPAGLTIPGADFTGLASGSLDTPAPAPPDSSAPPPAMDCAPCSFDPGTGGCDCSGSSGSATPSGGCE